MSPSRSASRSQSPKWMRFTAIANSIVPHHVPFPLVRRLQQICMTVSASITEEGELTPQQYTVIACLDDFPGIDQRRLGEMTGIDRTIVGQLIDQLEKQGLINRQVNGADRRARVLRLTRAGEIMRRRIRPKLVAAQARVLAPLSPSEQDTLIDLLIRVVKANEELARPGAGRRRSRKHATASAQGGTNDQNRPATVPRYRGDPLSRQPDNHRTG